MLILEKLNYGKKIDIPIRPIKNTNKTRKNIRIKPLP